MHLASIGWREEGQPWAGEEGLFLGTEPSPQGLGIVDRLLEHQEELGVQSGFKSCPQ